MVATGKHGIALACLAAASILAAAPARAALGVSIGATDKHQRITLAYQMPLFFRIGSLQALGELSTSYWQASGARRPDNLWQLEAAPFLRWWASERFFVEAGLGVNLFTRTRFADRAMSTAFQFGEHIGVGYQLPWGGRASLRFSHYSNASLKRPNSGLNVLQLHYVQPLF